MSAMSTGKSISTNHGLIMNFARAFFLYEALVAMNHKVQVQSGLCCWLAFVKGLSHITPASNPAIHSPSA